MWYWFYKWSEDFSRNLEPSWYLMCSSLIFVDAGSFVWMDFPSKWRWWMGANGHEAVQHSMFKQISGSNLCYINTPYTIYGTTRNLHNTSLTTVIHYHMLSALNPSSSKTNGNMIYQGMSHSHSFIVQLAILMWCTVFSAMSLTGSC